jgi:hypothetical protein
MNEEIKENEEIIKKIIENEKLTNEIKLNDRQ